MNVAPRDERTPEVRAMKTGRRVARAGSFGGVLVIGLGLATNVAARTLEPAFAFGNTPSCEGCHPGKMTTTMEQDHAISAVRGSDLLGRVCASGLPGWAVFLATLAATDHAPLGGCAACHVEGADPPRPDALPPAPARGTPAGDACVGCHSHSLDLLAAGGFPIDSRTGDETGTRCLTCHGGALAAAVSRAIADAPPDATGKPARDVHLRAVDANDADAVAKACFTCHLATSHRPQTVAKQRGDAAAVTGRFDLAHDRRESASCQAARCHVSPIHADARIERHQEILACGTCHTRQVPALTLDLTRLVTGNTQSAAPSPAITFRGLTRPRLRWVWERDHAAYDSTAGAGRQGAFRAKLKPFLPIEVVLATDGAAVLPGTYDRALLLPIDRATLLASPEDWSAAALAGANAAGFTPSTEIARLTVDASDLVSVDHATQPATEAARCGDCHVESKGNVLARVLREGIPLDPYHEGRLRSDFPERVPSRKHAKLEKDCAACHGSFRLDDIDLRCATAGCHPGMEGTHATAAGEDCAACHFEHRERESLAELTPASCQSAACHTLVHGGTELDRPEGRYHASGNGEPIHTTLVFSHHEHLKINEQEHRTGGCLGCHTETSKREFAIPSHEGEKGCAGGDGESCHTAAVPIAEAKKAPNRFCKECHTTADGALPALPPRSVHVRFTHRAHLEAKNATALFTSEGTLDCRRCHVGDFDGNDEFDEVVRKAGEYPRPMEACVECHRDGRAADLGCESCHTFHFRPKAVVP